MIDLKFKILQQLLHKRGEEEEKSQACDPVDRLHSYYTGYLLLLFSGVVGAHYFGKPMDCMVPAEYEKAKGWTEYITHYCFVRGTYRFYGRHFDATDVTESDFISYYQWIPMFLLFQMVCFSLPSVFWYILQNCFYIDVETVMSEAATIPKDSEKRTERIEKVSEYIYLNFSYRYFSKKGLLSYLWRRSWIFSASYVLIKLLFLANAFAQLYLVGYLINADTMWGFSEIIATFSAKSPVYDTEVTAEVPIRRTSLLNTTHSHHFPTVVMCKYSTSQFNTNIIKRPIQCLLTINYINERIFLILYFWYTILIAVTVLNIIAYFYEWLTRKDRNNIVDCILRTETADTLAQSKLKPQACKFVDNFLGLDGMLLLRFLKHSSNATSYRDIISKVWSSYCYKMGIGKSTKDVTVSCVYDVVAPLASGDGDNIDV